MVLRWQDGLLQLLEPGDAGGSSIVAADSWLVSDGLVLGLDLHRARFGAAVRERPDLEPFWAAVLGMIPRHGDWFPRVELRERRGTSLLAFRHRSAPARSRSVVLATHHGADPRTRPTVKGPDLEAMSRLRAEAQQRNAGEAVILSPEGFVIEGAHSAMLWWRGDTLCAPAQDLERIDSVTARTTLTLASALGLEVLAESVTPDDLDGLEVWALSALHGIRVVTGWVDGPQTAEQPGRAQVWRRRLGKLARPLPQSSPPLTTLGE
jgi:branched-subunit amino acid aminotransferase/4-amino-4-deoxychorismate lyase